MESLRLSEDELRVLEAAVKELITDKEHYPQDQDVATKLLKKIQEKRNG